MELMSLLMYAFLTALLVSWFLCRDYYRTCSNAHIGMEMAFLPILPTFAYVSLSLQGKYVFASSSHFVMFCFPFSADLKSEMTRVLADCANTKQSVHVLAFVIVALTKGQRSQRQLCCLFTVVI